ncbi:hypothetical protein [Cohnella thermotolerans]|uniref:hypothetical protein n=1 Tax=Cohnella thermotolerans TaxID=329858 RepID=UPI00040E3ACA|nr:hypothetical protein [Cohnella thermotolerans]
MASDQEKAYPTPLDLSVMEKVVIRGDLSVLNPQERLVYYTKVCETLGLNPLTKPFDYLKLDGKLVLYAKRDCTDQLRKVHGISITITNRERIGDVYCVTARAAMPDGRTDEAIGVVSLLKKETVWDEMRQRNVPTGNIVPLAPDELANALMKAETKAKRRVTLSIAGLGMMDESEIETVEGAQRIIIEDVPVNESGSNHEPKAESRHSSPSKIEPEAVKGSQGKSEPHRPENQSPKTTGNAIYRLVDMKTGVSPSGLTFVQMIVQNVRTGKTETVIAKTPETLEVTAEIKNDSQFELDLMVENGFKIVQAIRVLDHAA